MNPLPDVVERAARAGIRFQLLDDGRVHCSVRPPDELLASLRHHRDELARRIREWVCCWCFDTPRPAWFDDADTGLPICGKCRRPVGQARLDAEGFDIDRCQHGTDADITVEEVEATGVRPESFVTAQEVDR